MTEAPYVVPLWSNFFIKSSVIVDRRLSLLEVITGTGADFGATDNSSAKARSRRDRANKGTPKIKRQKKRRGWI
jgi:hypothetical protein